MAPAAKFATNGSAAQSCLALHARPLADTTTHASFPRLPFRFLKLFNPRWHPTSRGVNREYTRERKVERGGDKNRNYALIATPVLRERG